MIGPGSDEKSRFIANFYKVAIDPLRLIGQMDPICRKHPYKPAQSPSQQSGSWDGEEWEMHEIQDTGNFPFDQWEKGGE